MEYTLASAIDLGGYVSLIKFAVFLVMFFLYLPFVNWVYQDSQAVQTETKMWTGIVAGTGAASLFIVLFAPMFLIGVLIYLIALGGAGVAYVMHRDSLVSDFEKVMSVNQLKSVFVNEGKKIEKSSRGLSYITANGNDVPMPEPKSPESFGFGVACELFDDAIWRRAAQISFQPAGETYKVTYSIDGVAEKQEDLEKEEVEYLIFFLKQVADLEVKERRKPQTGPFKVEKDDKKYSWQVTTAGTTAGETLKIKLLEDTSVMKLEDLGMTPEQVAKIKPLREEVKQGVFLISGPKKSGVSATFYAMLKNHDPFLNNINTLERNPSAEMQNITQHVYTMTDSGSVSYARKLQTILRMGPDIMGVADAGDDSEVALLCARAAKDKKVVHLTMEAASVMQALQKWLKLVKDRDLAAKNLGGIVNQRLVRILCDECRQAYQPNPDLLRKFNMPADKIKVMYRPGEVEYDKRGRPIICDKCQGTGYYGRTGIFEMIMLNDELREVVRTAKNMQDISNQFRKSGMLYMQEESIKKCAKGVTSINEVIREFTPPQKKAAK